MTTTISVPLSSESKAFVEQEAAKEGYPTASDYLQALILDLQRRRAKHDLETKLLEGLRSPAVRMTDKVWEELDTTVRERSPQLDRE